MEGNGAIEKVDAVVVGAGVVGLAVARALALAGRETIILESEMTIGTGTSSRNSEVIHAGIYYPKGSLKARLCVAGRKALYAYCDAHGIPYRRCGKLIVAIGEEQRGALERVLATARGNGVDDITLISREEAQALEPALACAGALLSPSTGILDSHAYMLALLGDAQAQGAMIAYGSTVSGGRVDENGVIIDVAFGGCRHDARAAPPRELRRARSAIDRRLDRRLAAGDDPALALRQGQLLPASRPRARSRASSTPCPRLAGSACISRSISAARRNSALMSNGSSGSTTPSTRRAAARFYAAIRTILARASGRGARPRLCGHSPEDSGDMATERRISSSRGRTIMGSRD